MLQHAGLSGITCHGRATIARPERLRDWVAAEPKVRQVVIDEVQRAPELLSVVHSLIGSRRGLQVILAGSSARRLKRAEVDLLGDQTVWRTLHPLMAAEFG